MTNTYSVDIQHTNDEKYIIVNSEQTKYTLVSYPYRYHSQILNAYRQHIFESGNFTSPPTLLVQGGGILTIDHDQKTIKTYGQSGGYGKPDIEIVKNILQEHYPDYELDVTVTDYIRD
eukprot:TRINITY_DN3800_c0_g1_i1.p1 TRINITY_DN3800_c0_g1~~TRINITY_DN3800_c0_g1_i1.p1  ORF type:complete len:118 (-),score=11.61 TRINITY_DN3800_c0_g1_i1:35-388(-)